MEKQARKHPDVSPAGAGCVPSSSGGGSTSSKTKKNHPLRKKEKDTEVMGRPPRAEALTTDHEVFMQAFESEYKGPTLDENLHPLKSPFWEHLEQIK